MKYKLRKGKMLLQNVGFQLQTKTAIITILNKAWRETQ